MDERKQFTFYESFFKSLQRIKKKQDRADAYDIICAYALYNKEPDLDKLPDSVAVAFDLIRPVLDSARKKAVSGKQGGSKPQAKQKQNGSNHKQPGREKEGEIEVEVEGEIEVEKENEIENECYLSCGGGDAGARAATAEELELIGLKPGEYPAVSVRTVSSVREITRQLLVTYAKRNYCYGDCRNVFTRICLDGGTVSADAVSLLEYAAEQAMMAGKQGQWHYINGILDRLAARDIHSRAEAEQFDEQRREECI